MIYTIINRLFILKQKRPIKTLEFDYDSDSDLKEENESPSFFSKFFEGGAAMIGGIKNFLNKPLSSFITSKNENNEQSSEKEAMPNELTSIANFNNKKYKKKENRPIKSKNAGGAESKRLIKESKKKTKKKHKNMPKHKDKQNNKLEDKICNTLNDKKFQANLCVGHAALSQYKKSMEKEKKKSLHSLKDLNNLDNLNKAQLALLQIKETEEKKNKKEKEENQERNLIDKGTTEWNRYKKELIASFISEINYLYLIEEIFENYILEFKSEIYEKISQIFNNDIKDKYTLLIHQKHHSIFLKIKNTIPEIQTLNLITIGLSGAGKSTLTNVILRDDLSKEDNGIHSVLQTFKKYSNPNKIPGINIYETIGIGIESSNKQRNLEIIKKMIQQTFDKNLEVPQNSLHSILYCISNGVGSNRIAKEEIKIIDELDKLYGKNNILTVVFAQSLNNETEKRKNQLQNCLNNENIEIIDILAKDYIIKLGK